jgi:hypothetical protein
VVGSNDLHRFLSAVPQDRHSGLQGCGRCCKAPLAQAEMLQGVQPQWLQGRSHGFEGRLCRQHWVHCGRIRNRLGRPIVNCRWPGVAAVCTRLGCITSCVQLMCSIKNTLACTGNSGDGEGPVQVCTHHAGRVQLPSCRVVWPAASTGLCWPYGRPLDRSCSKHAAMYMQHT